MNQKVKSEADYWDELLINEPLDNFESDLKKEEKFTAVRPSILIKNKTLENHCEKKSR